MIKESKKHPKVKYMSGIEKNLKREDKQKNLTGNNQYRSKIPGDTTSIKQEPGVMQKGKSK